MAFDFETDSEPSLRSRFARLSVSARSAIVLGAIFIVQFALVIVFRDDVASRALGLHPAPLDWKLVPRLITYAFLHSTTDPTHVVFNAVTLFFAGRILEYERGPRTMLKIFTTGVVVGGAMFVLWANLRETLDRPLVGASAGCYAVLVGAAVCAPHLETFFRLPLWILVALLVGIDVLRMLVSVRLGTESVVAYVAHVGGAAAGFVMARRGMRDAPFDLGGGFSIPNPATKIIEKVKEHRERAREDAIQEREMRLDSILEKIHENGIASLTEEERAFLKRESTERNKK